MNESYGIEGQPTTLKNPQANSSIERMHLVLGDQLRTFVFQGSDFWEELDSIIQTCAYAIRATMPATFP